MRARLVGVLLCALLPCSGIRAQDKKAYRTGHLLKVEGVFLPAENDAHKANYLLYVQDGTDQHVGLYSVTYFGHDKAKLLKADTEIEYRISGKSLFAKTPDGKEIKARLCERIGNSIKCGSWAFGNVSPP